MANYRRQGSSREHRNFIPEHDLHGIPADYEDEPDPRSSPRHSRVRNVTGRQSPVDYIRGGPGVASHEPGHWEDRYSRADDSNRGRDIVNQGYTDSRDNLDQGGLQYSDMDPEFVNRRDSPVRQSPRGSGGYDNQSFNVQSENSRWNDHERDGYVGRTQSSDGVYNHGYQLSDGGGFDFSSRDALSDSHSNMQRMMHGDELDHGGHRRYIQHHGPHIREQDDTGSMYSIDFGVSNTHNVWDKLHTIRLRRKSQKSRKSARTLSRRKRGSEYIEPEEDEDYEGMLPSLQVRVKPKTLHERLAAVRSTTEAADTLRDSANQQTGVSSVKYNIKQTWQKNRSQMKGWLYQLELWASTFKEIEGRFGTATVSYFRFTRWLMLLNLYIFILMFSVVVIPYLALGQPGTFSGNHTAAISSGNKSDKYFIEAQTCTENYARYINDELEQRELQDKVLDFVQGTGWMERTSLFYGHYFNRTFTFPEEGTYNMSLAYLLTTIICFLISFILIVKNSGKSVKEAVTDQESSKTLYCNKVFCSWDYCITNEKAAKRKKQSYKREIEGDLEEERWKKKQKNRTAKEKIRLFFVRLFVNLFVLSILGASLYLIYYTTDTLLELEKQDLSQFLELLIQYLPSLAITILNFLVPLMFAKIVIIEKYGGAFELKITLVRTVLLRLASLGVLILSLYIQLLSNNDDNISLQCGNYRWEDNINNTKVKSIKCWETYVGQQFYKLALLDFVSVVLLTFLVEFPRKLVYEKLHQKFKIIKLVGEQEFDLPKNVLDIVYSQTLCWLGMFFTPMIPAITLMKVLLIFYVKRLTVLHNCIPPIRPYRASKSNSFFMTVLLFSFILAVIPVGYIIGNIPPSQSCGPFRWYSHENFVIFDTITNTVQTMHDVFRSIFYYLGTVAFFVPAIILLCLLMYYYWAASQGYKKMEKLLKNQLKLEGRDRQFLLSRMNEVIQRGELSSAANG